MWYITGLFENCHFLIKWKWQRAHHTAALYKRLLFPLPAAVLKWMASGCEYITLLSACRGVLCWLQWHHIGPLWKLTVVYSICLHQNALNCSKLQFFELKFHWIQNYWRKLTSFANCTVMCVNLHTWFSLFYQLMHLYILLKYYHRLLL